MNIQKKHDKLQHIAHFSNDMHDYLWYALITDANSRLTCNGVISCANSFLKLLLLTVKDTKLMIQSYIYISYKTLGFPFEFTMPEYACFLINQDNPIDLSKQWRSKKWGRKIERKISWISQVIIRKNKGSPKEGRS